MGLDAIFYMTFAERLGALVSFFAVIAIGALIRKLWNRR